jgi:gliding motility-associated-like protein
LEGDIGLPVLPLPMDLTIPNVITPNGDGTNDILTIENLMNWKFRELTIFNRWGDIVFRSEDYQNDWNGGGVSDGVYFGVLFVSDIGVVEQHDFMITIIGD